MEAAELEAALAQHRQLKLFLCATGDLPVPAELELPLCDAAFAAAEPPPSTPWVLASLSAERQHPQLFPAPPFAAQAARRGSPPASPAPPARVTNLAASLDFGLGGATSSAHAAELSHALATARHADLERQRLHRLVEMHATAADEAIQRAARLEAGLSAARSADAARARIEAQRDASLIAAQARIAELEAVSSHKQAAYESSLEGTTAEAQQLARGARAHEQALRRELEDARVEAEQLRTLVAELSAAQRAQPRPATAGAAAPVRGAPADADAGLASLRAQLTEARAVADHDASRADALGRQVAELRARLAAVGGGSGGGARGGGDEGGAAEVAQARADADATRRALHAAHARAAAAEAALSAALGREEVLQRQQDSLLGMQRDLESELADAKAAARAIERSARELRNATMAEAAADGRKPPPPPAEAARLPAAPPPESRARPQPQQPPRPPPEPDAPARGSQREVQREAALGRAAQAARGPPPLPLGDAPLDAPPPAAPRPSIRTNLAPAARVPFALLGDGEAGGGSAGRAELEARHMALSLERDKLTAEFNRMPLSSGRTLGERRQKAALEERLEGLAAELGALNVRLRAVPT